MADLPSKDESRHELIATAVVQNVCELPDYNSPDDQPELVMCTVTELHDCVMRALEGTGETSDEPHPLRAKVGAIVSAMRSALGRAPPYYCNEVRLTTESADALMSYIADLQQFHDWALPQITNPPSPAETRASTRPRGKPCTCDNCLGSSVPCRVDAGERLGELWYCRKAAESQVKASAPIEKQEPLT